MSAYVTGRTLDEEGRPIPGTGFEVTEGSWLEDRLRQRAGPITSHPNRAVWGVPLTDGEDPIRTLSVFGPGYDGPPAHYHEQSVELFDVESGALTMRLDGDTRTAATGDTLRVEPGVVHTFSNDTDERALVTTEIHSPGRLRQVLPTLGGLAHDRRRSPNDPLQQLVIADALDDNTVFTRGERLGNAAASALAPLARLAGYRGAYATYTQPAFWREHVEQPPV
ncbi:cupin domain-containing protein [Halovenus sp. WSH3]|uniref:Cupin domain-containing protein n=1 Tax=Halovenus carboxidivorans TaxID=2692199 RepID=A0A6B0T7H2_9EURY|nr:cupin domain-containing protein [Halovenus carboxidivorans]MXR52897.1 cupin domain-containing protein [Halovenus carboxidivorans]